MTQEEPPQAEQHSSPQLDVDKLHSLPSEQQDLYLLTFTSDLARHVSSLDSEGTTALQLPVKKEVLKIIELPSPAPTRAIRNNLGQCFAGVLSKGDRKILFETINQLIELINSPKGPKDSTQRHAAVYILGVVFETAGDSAISTAPLASTTLLRLIKPAQNNVGLRAACYKALGRILVGIGKSADEQISRDVWKQARQAATNEKSLLVQASACWCLEQLSIHTPFFTSHGDFDKLQNVVWKALDSVSPAVRRASSSCLSAIYAKHYVKGGEEVAAKPKKSKKPKPNQDADEDTVPERPSSPSKQVSVISFTLSGILRQLTSQYCKAASSNKTRAGIILCLTKTLRNLGENVVEEEYSNIAGQLFNDLLSSSAVVHNRYRLLISRKFVRLVLSDTIGRKILGEAAQINAVRFLVNSILKTYPQADTKDLPEASKQTIIGALDALRSLVDCLESATSVVAEQCREAILQVLEHPSYSVQVHASQTLKSFVLACPSQLLPSVTICMNSLNREVGQLTGPRKSPRRCLGLALGLAAAVSTAAQQPLYGSVDVYARILSQATSILKSSSGLDIRISSVQIQIAWIMVGSLMSLGPNFVKVHLNQLLLLWRNALPKPLPGDNLGQRTLIELTFLAHVRECALSSIAAFLAYNARLLTVDVTKRLANMLHNTIDFLHSLPAKKTSEDAERRLSFSLQLQDFDLMIRRRVFECSYHLLDLSPSEAHHDILQSNVLSLAISSFADSDNMTTTSLSSSIASSTGSADAIWELGDNSGFGITSLIQCLDSPIQAHGFDFDSNSVQLSEEDSLDRTIRLPVCDSLEHDALYLYVNRPSMIPSPPAGTGAIDAAISAFAISMPLQSAKVQQGALEQIMSTLAPSLTLPSTAKEISLYINVTCAILGALQTPNKSNSSSSMSKSAEVEKSFSELLHKILIQPDLAVRRLTAQSLGRLCKSSGSDFTTREVNWLIDTIINNREPNVRSGCAMALGCINSELGGMAAGLHMKNILGILTSLASDSHPAVHFWALEALSKVADATGLAFSAYVSSSLGMLAQLYVSESHAEEASSLTTSNMETDMPSLTALTRCIDSMINILGPDLQDNAKTRNMILTLTYQFQTEASPLIASQSLKCLEDLSMYAPGHISFQPYVRQLQAKIDSDNPTIRLTALTGLYNAMKRGAEEVIDNAESRLEEQMWAILHESYGRGIMNDLIRDWVQQSGISHIDRWIQRIQSVLTKVKAKTSASTSSQPKRTTTEPELQDEEAAGFAASAPETAKDDPNQPPEASQELLRWQVRNVVMQALNDILSGVAKDAAIDDESPNVEILQPRVAEIIKIAFSASTANVVEIRIQGIQILGRILQIFGRVPDPDFPEVTLLEQYQAQISSALTPAFAADSSPALAAEAIGVCAAFISTGIVTNVDRMGRILKLLVSALGDFSEEAEAVTIGDLKSLSLNAQTMVKLAVYSAWAELQIASHDQSYLKKILHPHLAKLAPLWLSSLREYAKLKFEPDISGAASSGGVAGGLDMVYASLSRETLLTFYQASWLKMVDAIASLIDEDSELVFDALDDKETEPRTNGEKPSKGQDINYRDEPVAFFFVLFGISFESLSARQNDEPLVVAKRNLDILQAMKKIVSPAVAGQAIYQDAIFSETMDILARMALTEGLEIQTVIVEIARSLCVNHPSARRDPSTDEGSISEDVEQLFELTRIIMLVISRHVPGLSETSMPSNAGMTVESVTLVALALTSLVDSASVFPTIIKADLHACILHIFSSILIAPTCQESLVPNALPIFRRFIIALTHDARSTETVSQLRTMLRGVTAVVKNAQKREHTAAVAAEKNSLLAGTILLTSAAKILPPNDKLIFRYVNEVVECLENAMTAKVAAGLSRTLLLLSTTTSTKTSATTEMRISSILLPRLMGFMLGESRVEGTKEARSTIMGALNAFILRQPEAEKKRAAAAAIFPCILERAKRAGEEVWPETSTCLIEFARRENALFRSVVGGMPQSQKSLVEKILRKGGGVGSADDSDDADKSREEAAPRIELKMDF